jgi:hypothetical protein
MTVSREKPKPERTPKTVFFVGNGIMRVAPLRHLLSNHSDDHPDLPPSWAEYMLDLWKQIDPSAAGHIKLDDFAQLVGPRQAEWFDQLFTRTTGKDREAPAFRMHLLGKILHRDKSVLSNDLLGELADLIVACAADRAEEGATADVITTNVDCLLEQNIAAKLNGWQSADGKQFAEAEIESIVDFRLSSRWRKTNSGGKSKLKVRIWKVHGCLRDLKLQLEKESMEVVKAVLDRDHSGTDFCGDVPTNLLADDLLDWEQKAPKAKRRRKLSGAFSQSEYFANMDVLLRHTEGEGLARFFLRLFGISTHNLLTEYCELLSARPMIFVGYSIPEVDVDVIYALQKHRPLPDITRWQLTTDTRPTTTEQLRQLGIIPRKFTVPAIGYAAAPGKLNAARRHEWRTVSTPQKLPDGQEDWRSALQRVSSGAWLGPQLAELRSLWPGEPTDSEASAVPRGRLVVAGLGSIWHGFAPLSGTNFPTKRRASAPMISVDQQVPGGSGLVPILIAAAIAGPTAVGRFAFLSNVPSNWSGWPAINDLSLSAGIDTQPWDPTGKEESQAVGRTSHIIFFDNEGAAAGPGRSRQRFIMDVQSLANEKAKPKGNNWSELKVPAARLPEGFKQGEDGDFLFTDKEADPKIIKDWRGPTVYETGTTGLQLVDPLRKDGIRPTIWTAGIGSFVRTMAALADPPLTDDIVKLGDQAVLDRIHKDTRLAVLTGGNDVRHDRYLMNVLGAKAFDYDDEKAYSCWLQQHWETHASDIWSLLCARTANPVLHKPHEQIGGGLVTTIHEGGLMALWQHRAKDEVRTESIVVNIETTDNAGDLEVTCALAAAAGQPQPRPIVIRVSSASIVLKVPGADPHRFEEGTDPIRRNSLAAGDTVRGAMAYGLWSAAYGNDRGRAVDIPRIMLASAALAALKCYAGSFIDFLRMLEELRGKPVWHALWATPA